MSELTAVRAPNDMSLPGRAHDILLVALIALRPLVWSGDASAWDNLAWLLLALVALIWLVIDAWRGRLPAWRFGVGGVIAAVLLIILLPAALRSPYPSTGLGQWGMAVIHLGFAAYLIQVVPGRERLAFGALTGALVVQCVIALGQWLWVFPGMTKALAGGDPAIAALETTNGDLAERVANGGLFGTFTLANTLAAFLLLTAVPLGGVVVRARGQARLFASAVLLLALVVMVGASSKGAMIALLTAGALVWTLHIGGRWRWLGPTGVLLGAVIVAAVPQVRALGAASAEVRLGYWQGAATLIAERPLSGHGLQAFAAHGTRAMPISAEPTRHVHNDVLEASVDGGVLAGGALALLLFWCACRRAATTIPISSADPLTVWRAAWPLLLIVPLFSALGMLASNLEWWPLGAGDLTWWLWPLVLTGVLIAVALLSLHLPMPPTWAWQLALAAFALHCLVDFNFQSPGIWGSLMVVAVLAGGRVYTVGVCTISRSVVTVLVIGLMVGLLFGVQRVLPLTSARTALNQDFATSAAVDHEAHLRERGMWAWGMAHHWPSDTDLMVASINSIPSTSGRLFMSRQLASELPWHASSQEAFAIDLAGSGRWEEAIIAMRAAVDANPAFLPRRQRLANLFDQAAAAMPAQAAVFQGEAIRERQYISELAPMVHPRNRLPKTARSGLPVQPTP